MATFRVTDPKTGRTIKLTGDSPPTEAELNDIFSSVPEAPKRSVPGMVWDGLSKPEQWAREGLQSLAQISSPKVEATGNMARDLAVNAPRIGFESLAAVAPGFISRDQILTAGALKGFQMAKPIIKGGGSLLAKGAEAFSGLEHRTPGALEKAATTFPTIKTTVSGIKEKGFKEGVKAALQEMPLFGPGKKAASATYEAAKQGAGEIRPALQNIADKKKFVEKVIKLSDQKGGINPTEALEARKELNAVKKQVTGEYFRTRNAKLDQITKKAYAEADVQHQKALVSENLRHVFPQNKLGGSSTFKTTVGGGVTAAAASAAGLPAIAIPLSLSPMVQGAAATGIGATAKALSPLANNPIKTVLASEIAQQVGPAIKDFSLKPDVAAIQKGQKIESKPKPEPAIEDKDGDKTLTKAEAYDFVRKATNDYLAKEKKSAAKLTDSDKKRIRKKARRLAKNAGYTWEGDF